MNTLWVEPPGGGTPVVVPLNNPDDFPFYVPDSPPGWWPTVIDPATGAPVVNGAPAQNLGRTDPLVIDLDNDGIELISAANSGVRYDFLGSGFATATGWVGADDGFLVRDVNDNGRIEGVSEMFGAPHSLNYIIGTSWEDFLNEQNGFAQLALLDSNTDGKIDSNDAAWADLQVWQDTNQDGVSQAAELHTLSSLGIASIDVANYELDDWHGLSGGGFWRAIEGNTVTHTGTVTMTDTSTREIVDAWFAGNPQDSVYTGDYTLDVRTLFLPTLRGYGQIKDLHVEMSSNEDLLDMVQDFLTSRTGGEWFEDAAAVRQEVAGILFAWAGIDGPAEDFTHGIFGKMEEFLFMRKWAGLDSQYAGTWFTDGPFIPYAADGVDGINKSWDNILDLYTARLVFQSGASSLFGDTVSYDPWSDTFTGDTPALSEGAIDDLATAAALVSDKEMFWHSVALLIDQVMGIENLSGTEEGWLDDAVDTSTSSAWSWDDAAETLSANTISITDSADTITGTRWDDVIGSISSYNYGNDTISGGDGDDTIYGGYDNDTLSGNDGNDFLFGNVGNDTLSGGAGNDILDGYTGNDTYIYESGHDVFREVGSNYYTDTDIVVFDSAIAPEDVSLHLARVDGFNALQLIVMVDGFGSITIPYNLATWAPYSSLIDELHFSDSTVLTIANMDLTVHGTDSDETINIGSFNGNITYMPGGGDDIIQDTDTSGNTTYIMGDGSDRITDYGGSDTLIIPAEYAAEDAHFYKTPTPSGYYYDLLVTVDGLGSLLIFNQFYGSGDGAVESVKFLEDNSTVSIASQVIQVMGTSGNDYMYFDNTGNDIIDGLAGDDYMIGGSGNDTYIFSDGHDDIYDGSGTDTISIRAGYDPGDITLARINTSDLQLTDSDGNTVRIYSQFGYYYGTPEATAVEYIVFSDTTTWDIFNMEIETHGTSSADFLYGGNSGDLSPDDVIYGYAGNDTINGDEGNDVIYGGEGNDTLYGGAGNDLFVFDGGLDIISDNNGTDTILITGGTTINDITISNYSSMGAKIVISTGVDEISLPDLRYWDSNYHVEKLIFDDGFEANLPSYTSWLNGTSGNDMSTGSGSDETLIGFAGNDSMDGGGGDDAIHGGAGNDELHGGAGTDLLHGGVGDDILYGEDGLDTLFGGAGADTFVFEGATAFNNVDVIKDFSTGDSDVIDIADVLDGYYTYGVDDITDFVQITDNGTDSTLYIDQDGGANNFVAVASILGVTGLTNEAALETAGVLVTH